MRITKKQIKAVKPLVERAIIARAQSWDAQREIEHALNCNIDGMDSLIESFAVGVPVPGEDATFTMPDEEVRKFFYSLERE